MDLDTLKFYGSGVFALLAAALGATTAIVVQRRSMRLEREKLVHTSRGRVNALSVAVFRDFLRACKTVERLAEQREAGESIDNEAVHAATAKMWLTFQEVEVFCDTLIEESAHRFVDELQEVVWQVPVDGTVTSVLKGPRASLFAIAGPVFRELD